MKDIFISRGELSLSISTIFRLAVQKSRYRRFFGGVLGVVSGIIKKFNFPSSRLS